MSTQPDELRDKIIEILGTVKLSEHIPEQKIRGQNLPAYTLHNTLEDAHKELANEVVALCEAHTSRAVKAARIDELKRLLIDPEERTNGWKFESEQYVKRRIAILNTSKKEIK